MGMQRGLRLVLVGLLAFGCGGGGDGKAKAGPDAQEPAVGRPEGVTGGPRVGVVVLATKGVRVRPSRGAEFPAEQGAMLVRDDRLVTADDPASFVVVELYNGHLVRFNQGTEIAVEKIAVFDAPRAKDDLAQRFEMMLRPEEREDAAMRGAISRVAGWNSRMTAAETIAVLPAERLQTEAKKDGASAPQADAPPANAPTIEQAPEPSAEPSSGDLQLDADRPRDPRADKPVEEKQLGGPHGKSSNKKPTDAGDSKRADDGAAGTGSVSDLPDKVSFTPDGGAEKKIALPIALAAERARLAACAGRGALLRARVVKGLIAEITVDNGKVCKLETSRALKLEDGWLEMRVK